MKYLTEFESEEEIDENVSVPSLIDNECRFCFEKTDQKLIFLTCNHVFHINCLSKIYIDVDNTETCKCCVCYKNLEKEELYYIYTIFLKNTQKSRELYRNEINSYQEKLDEVKEKYVKIEDDIKKCKDILYKNKIYV